jgi:hypothetical protein
MDFTELTRILESGTKDELNEFCSANGLVVENGQIRHKNKQFVDDQIEYWDKRQLVKKINLNS